MGFLDQIDDRQLVQEVGLMQRYFVLQMGDSFEIDGARTAHHAVDFVALFQKKLG